MIPEGFDELIRLAMKEKPAKPKSTAEIWDKFLKIVFMGGKRSEPEINFLINMLKSKTEFGYVKKTGGEDWQEEVGKILSERMSRIKDEDTLLMLKEFQKEMFRISASIKGGRRFFEKNKISPEFLDRVLQTKESTKEFIEDLVNDEDVSNIKYTKVIIWLHSLGYGDDFCPPSYQTKSFVNEVYGYYQFYEDDKYFMQKAEEFSEGIKKKVKGAKVRDIAAAIFYYITLRSMMPPRSKQKSGLKPKALVKFLAAKKLTLSKLSVLLSDFDSREKLAEDLYKFLSKN